MLLIFEKSYAHIATYNNRIYNDNTPAHSALNPPYIYILIRKHSWKYSKEHSFDRTLFSKSPTPKFTKNTSKIKSTFTKFRNAFSLREKAKLKFFVQTYPLSGVIYRARSKLAPFVYINYSPGLTQARLDCGKPARRRLHNSFATRRLSLVQMNTERKKHLSDAKIARYLRANRSTAFRGLWKSTSTRIALDRISIYPPILAHVCVHRSVVCRVGVFRGFRQMDVYERYRVE